MRCPICGAEHVREMRQCPDRSGIPVCADHCRNGCEYWNDSLHCGGCHYRQRHPWTNDEETHEWVTKIVTNVKAISARQKAEAPGNRRIISK